MITNKWTLSLSIVLLPLLALGQMIVEGYAYESGNRGYLNIVKLDLVNASNGTVRSTVFSDMDGKFMVEVPPTGAYELHAAKEMFDSRVIELNRSAAQNGKLFLKLVMKRSPGYVFEVTLAPKRENQDIGVDGIKGARVEVYNNTTKKEEMVLEANPTPEFRLNLQKGNHYTILVRKEGFLAKRMEAFVNVEDCILCFEGVGEVQPGVSDNLSEGNEMGVLLANVEMEPSFEGKKMSIRNLYYDLDKATLRSDSREELQNLINIMQDNPTISVEIGSHTDSRGKSAYNQKLSEARAEAVVRYLVMNGDISKARLFAKGYGEAQLTNHCGNGVECTDSEHQENRRTELTIIGRNEDAVFKTLAEMKKEEQMLEMILSLDEEDQIEVQSEDELQQILKDKGEGAQKSSPPSKSKPTPSGNSDGVSVRIDRQLSEKVSGEGMLIEQQRERLEEEQTKEAPNIDLAIEPAIPAATRVPEPLAKPEGKQLARDADGELLTGYMVVIHEANRPLAEDDKLFDRHSRIYSYLSQEGKYWYMLGRYPSLNHAEREVKAFLQSTYPGCRIVNFVDGEVK